MNKIENAVGKKFSQRTMSMIEYMITTIGQHLVSDLGLEQNVIDSSLRKLFEKKVESRPPLTDVQQIEVLPKVYTGAKTITLILDYSDKAHALFGDFNGDFERFKNDVLVKMWWIAPAPRLARGPGWLVTEKGMLSELEELMQEYGIPCDKMSTMEITEDDQECEISSDGDDDISLTNSEEEEKCFEQEQEEEVVVTKTEPRKPMCRKNEWGNLEEEHTGFVFKKLPVGVDGAPVGIVLGYQDPDVVEKGIESIAPLDMDQEAECRLYGWTHLSRGLLPQLQERCNHELYGDIYNIILKRELEES